ncbi:isoaspartyl peptidase/L-asparaginase [Leptolyngbya sp. FACHB-261]|uniref:isoaspartyl peptidase/L-asparaginase n=1 Tax=Leptolyngbya sp. FACHB-261 TaxID=2692806 RepID=UPI001683E0C1|nr:isoaspartyl peptidase/L-asparaginase [Leptolyngbya sp. FACHB-261]MBD2104445.1 isoaspartyl peptidase/L-asparaginase [Leptolyngbya sp. FACHB-261]
MQPRLIIHGGAGSALDGKGGVGAVRKSLYAVLDTVYPLLLQGLSSAEAVVRAAQLLEDDPLFNAGTGSVLQSDGQIRMSASLMDGARQSFSGVINVSRVQHPIELAHHLQQSDDRVLSDYGAGELARELHVPPYNPLTEQRLEEWRVESHHDFKKRMGSVTAGVGTIGAVALDQAGRLAAATSTGGRGFERIGRVSDSAMPAGNYGNAHAAVSCTGIGEHIIDEALASRIVVRVTDGLSLSAAFEKSFSEARDRNRYFGAIGLDAAGEIAWGKTSEVLLAAYHNGETIGDTLQD